MSPSTDPSERRGHSQSAIPLCTIPYGIWCHMKARLLFRDNFYFRDGAIREMVIWLLPESDAERPHNLIYRLLYGDRDKCLMRYDSERGKGDHRHDGEREEDYTWVSVQQLIADFRADINSLRGEQDE